MPAALSKPEPKPWVMAIAPYIPGRATIDGGGPVVKLSSNENPLGTSDAARAAFAAHATDLARYPDAGATRLRAALADAHDLDPTRIIYGTGSDELLHLAAGAYAGPGDEVIYVRYGFAVYDIATRRVGATPVIAPDRDYGTDVDAVLACVTPRTRLIYVANPNNPTGTMVGQAAIDRFMARVPEHVITVFDEAYFEFPSAAPDTLKYVREGRNVCVLRTFSKIHGLAALRIGYGLASKNVAALLQKARQPFNVNAIAQAGALAALADSAHIEKTLAVNRAGMAFYEKELAARGLEYVPSYANFLLIRTGEGDRVFREMLKQGVIIRAMSSYKLPDWVRISIGTDAQNRRCLEVLDDVLAASGAPCV